VPFVTRRKIDSNAVDDGRRRNRLAHARRIRRAFVARDIDDGVEASAAIAVARAPVTPRHPIVHFERVSTRTEHEKVHRPTVTRTARAPQYEIVQRRPRSSRVLYGRCHRQSRWTFANCPRRLGSRRPPDVKTPERHRLIRDRRQRICRRTAQFRLISY
jgi:hypothetical protein